MALRRPFLLSFSPSLFPLPYSLFPFSSPSPHLSPLHTTPLPSSFFPITYSLFPPPPPHTTKPPPARGGFLSFSLFFYLSFALISFSCLSPYLLSFFSFSYLYRLSSSFFPFLLFLALSLPFPLPGVPAFVISLAPSWRSAPISRRCARPPLLLSALPAAALPHRVAAAFQTTPHHATARIYSRCCGKPLSS